MTIKPIEGRNSQPYWTSFQILSIGWHGIVAWQPIEGVNLLSVAAYFHL